MGANSPYAVYCGLPPKADWAMPMPYRPLPPVNADAGMVTVPVVPVRDWCHAARMWRLTRAKN